MLVLLCIPLEERIQTCSTICMDLASDSPSSLPSVSFSFFSTSDPKVNNYNQLVRVGYTIVGTTNQVHLPIANAFTIFCLTKAKVLPPPLSLALHKIL